MTLEPLTLTISICLVFSFIVYFLREHALECQSSAERDSLAEEKEVIADRSITSDRAAAEACHIERA